MYFPEQIERESTRSTAAALSIESQVRKPDAMLVSSINPSESFAIALSHDLDVFRGDGTDRTIDARVHIRTKLSFFGLAHDLTFLHLLACLYYREGRLSGMLLQFDTHLVRGLDALFERSLAFVLFDLKTPPELRERDAPVFLHRVDLHRPLLDKLQPGG